MIGRFARSAVVVVALSPGSPAAFEERPFSARGAALGEAVVALSGAVEAVHDNPAGLSAVDRPEATVGHTRLLGLSEMPLNTAGVVVPGPGRTAWGAYLMDFGSALYREREAGVSLGLALTETAAAGFCLKAQRLSVDRYGSYSAWQADVGWLGRPWPALRVGTMVRNITQSRLGGVPEKSPAVFHLGGALDSWKGAPTYLAYRRDAFGDAAWRFGQEIRPHPAMDLRLGYQSAPGRWSLGCGFVFPGVSVDYAYVTHPALPDQHQINIAWRGSRRAPGPP